MAAPPNRYTRGRRPPPPGRFDFLKEIFNPFIKKKRRVKRRLRKKGKMKLYRIFALFCTTLLIAGVITVVVLIIGRSNANEVFAGDVRVGIIRMDRRVNVESLRDFAVSKIENDIGMKIQINEDVTFNPVRAPRNSFITEESVIAAISEALTYKAEAAVIFINGEQVSALRSMQEAEEIRLNLLNTYIQEGSDIIEKDFVENFEIKPLFVELSELMSSERTYRELTATTGEEQIYTVRSGDSLWQIAQNAGMTLDDIYEINPGLTANILVGDQITIVVQKPLLSVRTVEEVRYTEVIRRTEEFINNANQPRNYRRVIQQGRDGQQDVISHIERINGFVVDTKIIDYIITTPAVNDVIEVGTR